MSEIKKIAVGGVGAYWYAVQYLGYTGTREEFYANQLQVAEKSAQAVQAASEAAASAQSAQQAASALPAAVTQALSDIEDKRAASISNVDAFATAACGAVGRAQTTAVGEVTATKETAETELNTVKTNSVAAVTAEGERQIELVINAGEQAEDSAEAAAASAAAASTSESNAAASASSAAQSASQASGSATQAGNSAAAAAGSATQASQSATAAGQSARNAEDAAQDAQDVLDSIPADYSQMSADVADLKDAVLDNAPAIIDTASGPNASFDDGAEDRPMKSLVAHIEPVQAGSGDPSPDNVRPITGWTGVKVSRTGKNLYNKNSQGNILGMYLLYKTGGVTSSGSGYDTSDYIAVKPGLSYVLSGAPSSVALEFCFYDTNKVFIPGSGITTSDRVFTPPDNAAYVRFDYKHIDLDTIQLEVGSVVTDYEPYQCETYDISLPSEAGTVYGGTLDVVSGVLTVNMGMVDLGTLTWQTSLTSVFYAAASELQYKRDAHIKVLCTIYKLSGSATRSADTEGKDDKSLLLNLNSTGAAWAFVKDTTYTDATAFQTAMSGVMLVYELATPITYQLTPQEVKTLLGQNIVWADTGDVDVTYQADTKTYIDNKFAELQAMILENIGG